MENNLSQPDWEFLEHIIFKKVKLSFASTVCVMILTYYVCTIKLSEVTQNDCLH